MLGYIFYPLCVRHTTTKSCLPNTWVELAHLYFLSLFLQSNKIAVVCTYSSLTAEDEDVGSYQPLLFDSTVAKQLSSFRKRF